MIADNDPRRPALLELRGRQLIALSLDRDIGDDRTAMHEMWVAALSELGDNGDSELLGVVLALVGVHLGPVGRRQLAALMQQGIPPLLLKIEGTQPE
ncbi:hypothetical protein [Mycobacterium szulgai]|uniref:Uncharacterized protein n=1 Tax=Mycobacterium szulgai TaxID=1787 RepID=A0A1X2DKY7_MYCSZ|nr:hypothetical protein [Mycobacterium szulgai]MCV7076987.1 hypothetical protein [Mycobacterium szulgai]ORW88793.1 hypothetical protein AWC27_13925 [Mycobacterium szulgai]